MSATRYKRPHVDIFICIEMGRERNQGIIKKHPVYNNQFWHCWHVLLLRSGNEDRMIPQKSLVEDSGNQHRHIQVKERRCQSGRNLWLRLYSKWYQPTLFYTIYHPQPLLGRSLLIAWRKNSWNPERVPSVVTFVSVCSRATEHTFWPRNLIFGLSDPWDMRIKPIFFCFSKFLFLRFL